MQSHTLNFANAYTKKHGCWQWSMIFYYADYARYMDRQEKTNFKREYKTNIIKTTLKFNS